MEHTCCFFGHRKIEFTREREETLRAIIGNLVLEHDVNTFLFGSKSEFDDLCHTVVSDLKENYPHLKRIYVRAEFPYSSKQYESHLLEWCEETYFPEKILNAGKSVYIKRNYEMIDRSRFCVVYFDENYAPAKHGKPTGTKSGTKLAYDYALRKKKTVINLLEDD